MSALDAQVPDQEKTMAWSGLFDGVHGTPHTLINGRPRAEYLQDLMQRRGMFGFARKYATATGLTATVPTTTKQVDYALTAPVNTMSIPGSATDGISPPNRDITVENAHGDRRDAADGLTDNTLPATVDNDTGDYGIETVRNFGYAADLSGNGSVPLAKNPA